MENKKKGKSRIKSKTENKNKLDNNDKGQEIVKNISNLVDIDEKESQDMPDEEKINSNNKKQLFWALGMMASLVILFLISYAAFNRIGKFEYEGLTFTKEKFGEIPVFHYYYFFDNKGEKYMYNLFLRNDPRKNTVSITGKAVDDGIIFDSKKTTYISIDPEGLIGCKYTTVGISSLTSFLKDNKITVKGATPNYEQAELNNVEYITCAGNINNDVIILKGGNETRVVRDSENCHIIEIANCEVLEAIEKFEVQAILDAKEKP